MHSPKKIIFLSPYPFNKAPSQRLKYEQYYSFMEAAGYELTTSSFVDETFWKIIYAKGHLFLKVWYTLLGYCRRIKDIFRLRKFDVVYIHLWVTPLGLPIFEWLVKLVAKKIIYDIDDLIFLGHSSDANKNSKFLKGKAKAIYLMKKADHVITCTPMLDEFVRKFNTQTTDISSTINTDTYIAKPNYTIQHQITLGWSGSHSTSKFLSLLKNILTELSKELDFKLLVIGDQHFEMDGVNIEAIRWNATTEVNDLSRIDIGLYPLPDEPWVYGKSGLKALQYMALGIPTLATAIGANYRVIQDGENGFLIKAEQDWKNKILRLAKDEALREKMGKQARIEVENKFSLKANKDTYIGILNKLTNQ